MTTPIEEQLPTPRTDAKARKREIRDMNSVSVVEEVYADFARTLERALAAQTERAEKAEAEVEKPAQEQGWLSIESAPKTGSDFRAIEILGWIPDADDIWDGGDQDVIYWEPSESKWFCRGHEVPTPTHWKKLGLPPTPGAKQSEDRKKVTLGEARDAALEVMHKAEARRAEAVELESDAPCTSCGKPRSVLRKSLNDHLCNDCRAIESE